MVRMACYEKKNARNQTGDEIGKVRVNRSEEIRTLSNTFRYSDGNVFLYGPRGVGKTFLLKMLEHELRANREDFFAFYFPIGMQLGQLGSTYPEKVAFPILFMLDMLSSAWSALGGGRYSNLTSKAVIEERIVQLEDDKFHYMRNLASTLLGSDEKSGSSTFLLDAYKHLEEFQRIVLDVFDIKKVVALCDEANLMPEDWQKHIICDHLHLFSGHKVQFLFVADFVPAVSTVNVPGFFDVIMEVEGLSQQDTCELVAKRYAPHGFVFADEAMLKIFETSGGNPRTSIVIANMAISCIDSASEGYVSPVAANKAISKYKGQIEKIMYSSPNNRSDCGTVRL